MLLALEQTTFGVEEFCSFSVERGSDNVGSVQFRIYELVGVQTKEKAFVEITRVTSHGAHYSSEAE